MQHSAGFEVTMLQVFQSTTVLGLRSVRTYGLGWKLRSALDKNRVNEKSVLGMSKPDDVWALLPKGFVLDGLWKAYFPA